MSVLHLDAVVKSYGGLRPLRLKQFELRAGEAVALAGFDQTTAEVFANLVTGATLPEEGTVTVFGRSTAEIVDSDDWLATVDRFGIISERVVLLDLCTPLLTVAMSLTLADDVRRVAAARDVAVVILAAAAAHAAPFADRVLKLNGGTGELSPEGSGLFRRIFG